MTKEEKLLALHDRRRGQMGLPPVDIEWLKADMRCGGDDNGRAQFGLSV